MSGTGTWDRIMRVRADEMLGALAAAGVNVLPLSPDAAADAGHPEARGARAFAPDFVTAPNFNYLLLARSADESLLRLLDRPAMCMWDDPLGALALWRIHEDGGTLGHLNEPRDGDDVLARFRDVMSNPGTHHFAWDSGHAEAVAELGLTRPEDVTWYPIATYRPFLEQGRTETEDGVDVAFFGNLYAAAAAASNFNDDKFYAALTKSICERKVADLATPVWQLLNEELATLSDRDRDGRGLYPQATAFWDYYLYIAWMAAGTAARVSLLTAVERPVHLYGLFADPETVRLLGQFRNLIYRGDLDHSTELPGAYAATKINVCIANGLIYNGVPSKLIDCLASGGFALSDPKDDLVRLFGRDVEAIFFRNADELNAKIEYFLPRRDERREIVHELRKTIERECRLERLFERVLASHAAGTGIRSGE
jgi:hypothetical protein